MILLFAAIEGPSSCLREWMQKRIRVKVVTRSFKSVRGTCTGFIVAFDKYLNLVSAQLLYYRLSVMELSALEQTPVTLTMLIPLLSYACYSS